MRYCLALLLLPVAFTASIVEQQLKDNPPTPFMRLGSLHWRHILPAAFVAFPDDKTVLSLGFDDTARFWDLTTGKPLRTFSIGEPRTDGQYRRPSPGSPTNLCAIALSPDGKSLVTCYQNDSVRSWDVATGKELPSLKGIGGALALAFSPDGRYVAGAVSQDAVHLWEWRTGNWIRSFGKHEKDCWLTAANASGDIVFAPDGKSFIAVYTGYQNANKIHGVLKHWDITTGKVLGTIDRPSDHELASPIFSSDGKTLFFSNSGGEIVAIDLATNNEAWRVKSCQYGLNALTLSVDAKLIYSRAHGDPAIRTWDPATGNELDRLGPPAKTNPRLAGSLIWHPSLAVSPDGRHLATGGDGTVLKIVDSATGQEIAPAGPHRFPINSLQFAADGKCLVSWTADRTVCQWDVQTGKPKKHWLEPGIAHYFAVTSDGAIAAAGHPDSTIVLTATATGKVLATISLPAPGAPRFSFSPDGKTLAVSHGRTRLYDVPSGRERCVLPAPYHNEPMRDGFGSDSVCSGLFFFSPDSKYIAAQGGDLDWLVLCATDNGKLQSEIVVRNQWQHVRAGVFSPDSRSVALDLGPGSVGIWERLTGQLRFRVQDVKGDPDWDSSLYISGYGNGPDPSPLVSASVEQLVAFSPNGKWVSQVGVGDKVRLWSATTGKLITTFTTGQGFVTAMTFAPKGDALVTGGADTTILFWKVTDLNR